jgi:hypothetical protein
MRSIRWQWAVLVVLALAAGCWYQRPNLEKKFEDLEIGMAQEDIVDALGEPSFTTDNEMIYLYDDPEKPVRYRFVLNDQQIVVEKYYEPKAMLAKKAKEVYGELDPIESLPGEEGRTYPGAPLKRFETTPGAPEVP